MYTIRDLIDEADPLVTGCEKFPNLQPSHGASPHIPVLTSSSTFIRTGANVPTQSRPGVGSGGPWGPLIPASPRMALCEEALREEQEKDTFSAPSPFQIDNFESVGSNVTSDGCFPPHLVTADCEMPVGHPSQLVNRKVNALLSRLTMETFDSISDQIIQWVNGKDGRTLAQVTYLVLDKATEETVWSEMYARLCRKMTEQISPDAQNDRIKNSEGKPIAGEKKRREEEEAECKRMAEEEQIRKDEEVDDIVETPSPVSELASVKRDISVPPPSALLTACFIENLSEVEYPEGIKSPRAELNANAKDGRFRYDPSVKRDISVPPPSALLTACFIENLSEVEYPEGIKSPRAELNANAKDGRFRYDRDFLMQFIHICKEKPPTLPPLDYLSIGTHDVVRGRHRNVSSAVPPSASRQSVGLGITGSQKLSAPNSFQMGNFESSRSKLSEERSALSSDVHSAPTSSVDLPFNYLTMTPISSEGCLGNPTDKSSKHTRSKRGQKRGDSKKGMLSQQGQ
ncbi:hypothetical protein AZE42_02444, partial [Rhizopogon vesiculosus]